MDPREYQDLLAQWQELDRQAAQAECKLRDVKQFANSPEAAAWVRQAFALRRDADACLLRLLRSLHPSPRNGARPDDA